MEITQILKKFNFELLEDACVNTYSNYEEDRYTNINFSTNRIEIITNYTTKERNKTCSIKEGDFEHLYFAKDDYGIYCIAFVCTDTKTMKKYLSKLYQNKMRIKKLERCLK